MAQGFCSKDVQLLLWAAGQAHAGRRRSDPVSAAASFGGAHGPVHRRARVGGPRHGVAGFVRAEDVAVFHVATAVRQDGAVLELRLRGELDVATVDDLQDVLERASAEGYACIVVDLSGLEFIDSSGLEALAVGHKRQRANGGDVVLRNPNQRIRRVLEIVGFEKVFAIT